MQYAKKPPSKVKRDTKRSEMHKSETRVTRSQSKNTENVDLSDIEIARNSCSTREPAIPDIGHVQSPVSVHGDLNCCSTPVSMHEPDNAPTPPSSSPVTRTVNNDLISDHDDPNRDSGQEEGTESGNGTHQVPHKVVDEEDWEQDCYFLHTIGQYYDHGHGLKFKCSLCNIFICYCCKRKNIHYMHGQHLIDPFNDI